jgi:DNA-binding GntR family transcriptional regulator
MNNLDLTAQAGVTEGTRVQSLRLIVQDRIVSGQYRPGSWIREAELQREFGLSNGPVREALQGVVGDGLAERAAFRGVRVIDLNEREIDELFEVRFALLGFAAERAAEHAGTGARRSAELLKTKLRKSSTQNRDARTWLGGELSHWVLGLAANSRLQGTYERILLQSLIYVALARKQDGERDALLNRAYDVIDAVVEGQAAKARDAVGALNLQTLRYLGHGDVTPKA